MHCWLDRQPQPIGVRQHAIKNDGKAGNPRQAYDNK
jgi:hypothetical protein